MSKDAAPAVARTLDVFELFASVHTSLRLVDIAEATNIPVSTCLGLLRTLQSQGYLWSAARDRSFYPTARLLALAETLSRRDEVVATARPVLESLRAKTGETAVLAKRLGLDVIYLDVLEGPNTIRYAAPVGERKPLHSSALGKACMSLLAPKALDGLLAELPMARITSSTITDRELLKAEIVAGRERGWLSTRGENRPDVAAIAVGRILADEQVGIAVAGPAGRIGARWEELVAIVTSSS